MGSYTEISSQITSLLVQVDPSM